MHEVHLDRVLAAIAERHAVDVRGEVVEGLREIWNGVAADLTPEEAVAVLWSVAPHSFVVGGTGHAQARARMAAALYPALDGPRAVSRFRALLKRPAVRSTVDALRAEEMVHLLGERHRVRAELWAMVAAPPPENSEPKDIIAHNRHRRAVLADIVALDSLALPPALPAAPTTQEDARKKLVDRLKKIV